MKKVLLVISVLGLIIATTVATSERRKRIRTENEADRDFAVYQFCITREAHASTR